MAYAASDCSNIVPLVADAKFFKMADCVKKSPEAALNFIFWFDGISQDQTKLFSTKLKNFWSDRTIINDMLMGFPTAVWMVMLIIQATAEAVVAVVVVIVRELEALVKVN